MTRNSANDIVGWALGRIYSVRKGSPPPFPSPPRRGEARWPRWDESLISDGPAVVEGFSLSPGERAGVRASVFRTELFRLIACLRMWGRLPACQFTGRPRPVFRAAGCRRNWQAGSLPYIFRQALILVLCASFAILPMARAADLGETVVVVY